MVIANFLWKSGKDTNSMERGNIRATDEISSEDGKRYLFTWDDVIQGKDIESIREFLSKKFGIDWVKTAKINKFDEDKVVNVSNEMNSLSLKLNNEKTEANLNIKYRFKAKQEDNKVKIYGVYGKRIEFEETFPVFYRPEAKDG